MQQQQQMALAVDIPALRAQKILKMALMPG
jgi:hypothetical protein